VTHWLRTLLGGILTAGLVAFSRDDGR
jgi:hypothetical protein